MSLRLRRILAIAGGTVIAVFVFEFLVYFGFIVAAFAKSTRKGCPFPDNPNTDFWNASFVGFALLAGLSFVLLLWDQERTTKKRYRFYILLLVIVLPISSANVWGGDCFIAPPIQAIIDLILVILGLIAMGLLWDVRPNSVDGKVIKAVTLFMLAMWVVFVPAIYGTLYLLYKFHWIEHSADAELNIATVPDWLKVASSLPSAVIAMLDYFKQQNSKPSSAKARVPKRR